MKSRLSLKENYIYSIISQVTALLIPVITTPYLARVLLEEGNGQYSFCHSIITYFVVFANLGFNVYGQREIAKERNNKLERNRILLEILVARLLTTGIALFLFYILLCFGAFPKNDRTIMMVLSLQIIASAFDVAFFYQGIENFRVIAIRTILVKLISMVGIFLFIKKQDDVWIYALCLSGSILCSNLMMWPSLISELKHIQVRNLRIQRHLKPMLLVFLPSLAVTLYSVFDKTMIGLLASDPLYHNGCYEQAYKINSIALIAVTIISPLFTSKNSFEYKAKNTENFKKNLLFAINYIWCIALPLIAGFIVLADYFSSWFLGAGYDIVPLLLRIMAVRFLFSGFSEVFGTQLFIAIGKESYATIATACAAIMNMTLNYVLIPDYGAVGAAVATALGECVVTLVLGVCVIRGKYISLVEVIRPAHKYLLSTFVMLIVMLGLKTRMHESFFSFALIGMTGVLVYAVGLYVLKEKFVLTFLAGFKRK